LGLTRESGLGIDRGSSGWGRLGMGRGGFVLGGARRAWIRVAPKMASAVGLGPGGGAREAEIRLEKRLSAESVGGARGERP
jgi:hypothetical protein